MRALRRRTTTLVSVNQAGTDSGNGSSGPPDIFSGETPFLSANGRIVAFMSDASDLVATDNDGGNGCVRASYAVVWSK